MKLTNANYFSPKANREYFSVSQWKSFRKCPNMALAEIRGNYIREETPALLVGSYVDAYFDNELEAFKTTHPALFKKDGTLKAEYIQAEQIIERIKRDRLMMKYLAGGQRQVIMTGEIEGVQIKIKIDTLHPDKIVDGKVMKDFAPIYVEDKGRLMWWEAWNYDVQGAVYQEIVYQNTGKRLPFFLAAATKEKVTDIDVLHIEQNHLDFGMEEFKKEIVSFDAIKKGIVKPDRCETCDWCKETKKLKEPTSSMWIY